MLFLTFLISLSLSWSESSHIKECGDCMSVNDCTDAVDLLMIAKLNVTSKTVVLDAFCGTENINGKEIHKICCSELKIQARKEIETHENIALLPESCGDIDADRNIPGDIPDILEYPWLALISIKKERTTAEFKCGGSIVNSRYILTAAHCIQGEVITGVRVGEFDIRSDNDCQGEYPHIICESHIQDIGVEDMIIHKFFRRIPRVENDIALLRVREAINFSYRNVAPICLPVAKELRDATVIGEEATIVGWGLSKNGSAATIPRRALLPILRESSCNDYLDRFPKPDKFEMYKNFCAGRLGQDTCRGDPGGPLMLEGNYKNVKRVILYGLVSSGPIDCGPLAPQVYTDVSKYITWILDNIKV